MLQKAVVFVKLDIADFNYDVTLSATPLTCREVNQERLMLVTYAFTQMKRRLQLLIRRRLEINLTVKYCVFNHQRTFHVTLC